ncbi:endodeoxyribonuclease [Tulasnella sp. JGI-2019a]|nr:endodeoxyribonuclease [Tulasnella sp. JGI-2019a]KAG9030541.1 endodeoxyribonuclease [Tulasnella sp. JGI-2019a]
MNSFENSITTDQLLDDPYWDGLVQDLALQDDAEDEDDYRNIIPTSDTLLDTLEDFDIDEFDYIRSPGVNSDDFPEADSVSVASGASEFDIEGMSTQEYAIACLEAVSLSFLSQLDETGPTDVILPEEPVDIDEHSPACVPSNSIALDLVNRGPHKLRLPLEDGSPAVKTLQFPKRKKNNTQKMAALLAAVSLSHGALVNNIPTTKRDMFYKDVPLFRRQSVVDKLVDDLAATFELTRSDLNIRASSKGLFAGSSLTIGLCRGGEINGLDFEGTLIPCDAEIAALSLAEDISWVLVVEKEVSILRSHNPFTSFPYYACGGGVSTGGISNTMSNWFLSARIAVGTWNNNYREGIP